MLGINSASGTLGFAGAQEGDGGEVRPVHGDSSVHPMGEPCRWWCPQHRLACGLEMMGQASMGLCSHLQGRAGPAGISAGLTRGDFVPPHSRFEAEVLAWAQGHGSCIEGGSSIPPVIPRDCAEIWACPGTAGREASCAAGLHP